MKLTAQEYARRVQRAGPHSPLGTDCLWAFGVGGGICLLGEVLRQWYLGLGLEADLAGTLTSCTLTLTIRFAGRKDCTLPAIFQYTTKSAKKHP